MTVVIPTLEAGPLLRECVCSLERQTWRDFEIVIVDNSGKGLVRRDTQIAVEMQVIENGENAGFGGAINQAVARSGSPYVAVLNDDASADAGWLEALVRAMEARSQAGMCASRVMLAGQDVLDSAGMLLCGDGSSKQRGHGQPPEQYPEATEALFPSGSAAMYRRAMLDEVGGFDERFFLYCEDTDLGLRGVWAGWRCLYEPRAVVHHHYSKTAGRASPLKAYLVERNRLFVLVKNFPVSMLVRAPVVTAARYFWHVVALATGKGAAAGFRQQGNSGMRLVWIALHAHLALFRHMRRLLAQRREIRRKARISATEFCRLVRRHSISARQVAAL